MAIIIKSHKDTLLIDSTIGINYNSGNVLQGEKDMYERIVRDCEASSLTWPTPIARARQNNTNFFIFTFYFKVLHDVFHAGQ